MDKYDPKKIEKKWPAFAPAAAKALAGKKGFDEASPPISPTGEFGEQSK